MLSVSDLPYVLQIHEHCRFIVALVSRTQETHLESHLNDTDLGSLGRGES